MTGPQLAALRPRVKSPFLVGLAQHELNEVLGAARECRFLAGTILASQGTPANSLFLLLSGRARFFLLTPDGHKILLMWLPVGEVIGGAALQSRPSDYIVSTETVKDSTVLVWERPVIRRLAIRYPRLLENVNLAQGIGRRAPKGVELDVTNEELAQAANVTHFTASRLISQWQRQGVLVKTRGKILLRNPEKLFLSAA
jgi:CRP-like cAMP-binding protein